MSRHSFCVSTGSRLDDRFIRLGPDSMLRVRSGRQLVAGVPLGSQASSHYVGF